MKIVIDDWVGFLFDVGHIVVYGGGLALLIYAAIFVDPGEPEPDYARRDAAEIVTPACPQAKPAEPACSGDWL